MPSMFNLRSITLNYDGGLSSSISLQKKPIVYKYIETMWLDSRQHSTSHGTYAESAAVLEADHYYKLVVDGNWTAWSTGGVGTTITIKYPSPGQSSTMLASFDYDTYFGSRDIVGQGHTTETRFNLGAGYAHFEPIEGPFTAPRSDHTYMIEGVRGLGATLRIAVSDTPISDNNGMLKVDIYG